MSLFCLPYTELVIKLYLLRGEAFLHLSFRLHVLSPDGNEVGQRVVVARVVQARASNPAGFFAHLPLIVEAVQHVAEDAAREEYVVHILLVVGTVPDGELADTAAALNDAEEARHVPARSLQPLGGDTVALTDRAL